MVFRLFFVFSNTHPLPPSFLRKNESMNLTISVHQLNYYSSSTHITLPGIKTKWKVFLSFFLSFAFEKEIGVKSFEKAIKVIHIKDNCQFSYY